MRKLIVILTSPVLVGCAANAEIGSVITSWPDPLYNKVNGIAFEGEYVWLNNRAGETVGVLKCTTNGSLVNEIGFPYHGWGPAYGLAYDLWTVFHQPVGTIAYDWYVKYTTTGSFASDFGAHDYFLYYSSVSVSWDGQYLWTEEKPKGSGISAGKYTTAGSLVGTFAIAPNWNTAAGYYNHQLWAGGNDGYIYGMAIGASTLAGSFAAPGGSCAAVGFDEYLWTADKNTPQYIYKVDIDVVDVAPASVGRVKALYR
jgi:hypothetical protein